jgi:CheY-specific phosphatase CheX
MAEASLEQALAQATADVLEMMFFTSITPGPEGTGESGPQIAVRVSFMGGRRGMLGLRISEHAARMLATDFLAVETEAGPNAEQVGEVVRELANMICGNALSHVERSALRLAAPELVAATEWNLPAGASRRSFDLGSGTLTVALAFRDGENA